MNVCNLLSGCYVKEEIINQKSHTMKNETFILLLACASICYMNTYAQENEYSKEEKSIQLSEVTVKAVPVIRKADRDLYIPSDEVKKISSDGLDILSKMQIPTILVDPILNKISRAGDNVELRINGRKVDVNQIRTLAPETIVRIEFHENPSLRYGSAPAVLDYIVKNQQSGGALQSQLQQCPVNGFGNQWVNLKLNNGKSQFEANYYGHMRLNLPMFRENSETYVYPDGHELSRLETPIGGTHDTYDARSYMSYNYVDPDKTNFYASFYYNRESLNLMSYDGLLTMNDGSRAVTIHDAQWTPGTTSGLNLYLDKKFHGRHTLVFDVNAGYYIGHSARDYRESFVDDGSTAVDIDTRINDRNFALTAEANYIKEWDASKFTGGITYMGHWNRSEYQYLDNLISRQRADKVSFFGEYQQRIGKRLHVSAGVAGTYSNTRIVGESSGIESFLLRPRLSASYRFNDKSQARLIFNTNTGTPSLSQMVAISQNIDGMQTQVGNPNLKHYNTYRVVAQYNYTGNRVGGQLSAFYQRSPNAIMDYRYWSDDGHIVTSYANQSGATSWGVSLSPRLTIVPQWVTISGTLDLYRNYTRGIGYRHCITDFSGSGQLQVTHWGLSLTAMYQKGGRSLWGETLSEGETVNFFMLGYRYKGWSFDAGLLLPFGRYKQGTETLSRYAHIERIMRTKSIERMPIISVSYRLNWDRKVQQAARLIDSDAGVQQSKTAGK